MYKTKPSRGQMIEALAKSIQHWYTNLMLALAGELTVTDIRCESCPCCLRATIEGLCDPADPSPECRECILVVDGHSPTMCECTPWEKVNDCLSDNDWGTLIGAVEDQIQFLENVYAKGQGGK